MRGYLERLVHYLAATCAAEPAPAFECRAVPLQLPVTTATRIGLIVNELAVNALKYAFDGQGDARVSIVLSATAPTQVVLEVCDNGRGLPAHVDPATATSLGLRLVAELASSIGATVEITRDAGTTFRLAFAAER
jgi:two-component sensor histidine kinase